MQTLAGNSSGQDPAARICVLCGAAGSLLYSDMSDRHFGAPGAFSLLECPSCRLVWLDPRPEAAQLPELYQDYYTHDASEEQSWLRRMVRLEIPAAAFGYSGLSGSLRDRWLAKLLSWLGPTRQLAQQSVMWLPARLRGRLLDVGCGSGEFLVRMQALGWSVAGVEPDPKAADAARKRLGSKQVYEDLAASELPPGGFDAVTLSHVAEHLLDLDGTLRGCLRLLKPGGRLVLTTPNTASLGRRYFGRAWVHWDPPRHIQLFRLETLGQLVERAGFDVTKLSTPSSSAHFVWQVSTRLRSDGSTPGIAPDTSMSAKLASVLFLGFEYGLSCFGLRCGEELLVIAEKPGGDAAKPA